MFKKIVTMFSVMLLININLAIAYANEKESAVYKEKII